MTSIHKVLLIIAFLSLSSGMGILTYDRFIQGAIQGERVSKLQNENFTDKRIAYAQLREAEEYLRQNTEDSSREAYKLFNRVMSLNLDEDTNQLARYGMAVALERTGEQATTLDHLRILKKEGVKNNILSEKVDYRLGKILLSINHVEEGRAILDSLLYLTKDDRLRSDIHTTLGSFFSSRGAFTRARENFDIALKYNPENLHAELGRAEAYKNIKRSLSYDYYDDYFIGNSNLHPEVKKNVYNNLKYEAYDKGVTAYRSGKYKDAIYFLTKATAKYTDPSIYEKSMYWLGESYLAAGNTSKASQSFHKVIRNTNTSMDQPALIKLGIIYFQNGSYEKAANSFKNAQDKYPDEKYSEQAGQWLDETMKMIEDKSSLQSMPE